MTQQTAPTPFGRRAVLLGQIAAQTQADRALEEGLAGDWEAFRRRFMALVTPLRRLKGSGTLCQMEADLAALGQNVLKALEAHVNRNNSTGNDNQSRCV